MGSATKNNMQTVCVLLNCGPMFEDCQKLLEKSFAEYRLVTVIRKFQVFGNMFDGNKRLFYVSPQEVKYPIRNGEKLRTDVTLTNALQTASVYVDDKSVGTFNLVEMPNSCFHK